LVSGPCTEARVWDTTGRCGSEEGESICGRQDGEGADKGRRMIHVPVMVKNPDFKHLWVDPNAEIEWDYERGQVKMPLESTPFITKIMEFRTEEEYRKWEQNRKE
jgi:hypothetical protein